MLSKSRREILCLRAISYGGVKGNGEQLYVCASRRPQNIKIFRDKEESRKGQLLEDNNVNNMTWPLGIAIIRIIITILMIIKF